MKSFESPKFKFEKKSEEKPEGKPELMAEKISEKAGVEKESNIENKIEGEKGLLGRNLNTLTEKLENTDDARFDKRTFLKKYGATMLGVAGTLGLALGLGEARLLYQSESAPLIYTYLEAAKGLSLWLGSVYAAAKIEKEKVRPQDMPGSKKEGGV